AALRARRRTGTCSGVAALGAYLAAATVPPDQAAAMVDAAVAAHDAHGVDDPRDGASVFVTGSAHPDASVYDAIEASALVVIGEDHDTGDAAWIGDAVDAADLDEAIAQLARRHATRPPLAARSRTSERAIELDRRLDETGAAGVLALIRDLDDAPAWDLSGQRVVMDRRGLPFATAARIAPDAALREAEAAAATLAGELAGAGQVAR
ncbi:MAG TPA: 2-hydroxyacyl-CoA dehydratase, partial [Agromyces sp.]